MFSHPSLLFPAASELKVLRQCTKQSGLRFLQRQHLENNQPLSTNRQTSAALVGKFQVYLLFTRLHEPWQFACGVIQTERCGEESRAGFTGKILIRLRRIFLLPAWYRLGELISTIAAFVG